MSTTFLAASHKDDAQENRNGFFTPSARQSRGIHKRACLASRDRILGSEARLHARAPSCSPEIIPSSPNPPNALPPIVFPSPHLANPRR